MGIWGLIWAAVFTPGAVLAFLSYGRVLPPALKEFWRPWNRHEAPVGGPRLPQGRPPLPAAVRVARWLRRRTDGRYSSDDGYQWRFGVSALAFVVLAAAQTAVAHLSGPDLPVAPQGIVSLELAFNARTAQAVLDAWRVAGRTGAQMAALVEDTFLFIPAYVTLTYGLCRWGAARARESMRRRAEERGEDYEEERDTAARIGEWLAGAQVGAGLLDVAENICLFWLLPTHDGGLLGGAVIVVGSWCAAVKFTLIGASLIYWAASLHWNPDAAALFRVLRLVAASFAVPLLACVALFLDQGQEALRVLAEDMTVGAARPSGALTRLLLAYLAALVLAGGAGYWARLLVHRRRESLERPAHPGMGGAGGAGGRGGRWGVRHLPRAAAAGTLLLAAREVLRTSRPFLENAPDRNAAEAFAAGVMFPALVIPLLIALGVFSGLLNRRRGRAGAGLSSPAPDAGVAPGAAGPAKDGTVPGGVTADPAAGPAAGGGLPGRLRAAVGPERFGGQSENTGAFLGFAAGLGALLLLVTVALAGPDSARVTVGMGSVAALLFGAGLILPVFSLAGLAAAKTRMPLVPLLFGLAVVFTALDLNDNHRIRQAPPAGPASPVATAGAARPGDAVPDARLAFLRWLAARKDLESYHEGGDPARPIRYPVFFVAAQGGGIRAAYQTAQTLAALQRRNPAFAQHTFAISSVSGGSLGAAVFAAMAERYASNREPGPSTPDEARVPWTRVSDGVLGRDLLAPPIAGLLTAEFVQRFLPFAVPPTDRSRALEYALGYAWRRGTEGMTPSAGAHAPAGADPFERSFYGLEGGRTDGAVPALFINATCAETGDRLVIGSLAPADPAGAGPVPDRLDPDGLVNSRPCVNGLQLLGGVAPDADPPLATAAVLSARFPVISSAGGIHERQVVRDPDGRPALDAYVTIKRRHVDGGYYENSGVSTLTDVLTALGAPDLREQRALPAGPDGLEAGLPRADAEAVRRTLRNVTWVPVVITLTFTDSAEKDFPRKVAAGAAGGGKGDGNDGTNAGASTAEGGGEPAESAESADPSWRADFPDRPRAEGWDSLSPLRAVVGAVLRHNELAHRRLEEAMRRRERPFRDPKTGVVAPEMRRLLDFRFRSETAPLPLGWMLSRAARAEIQREIGDAKVRPDDDFQNAAGLEEFEAAIHAAQRGVDEHNARYAAARISARQWNTVAHNRELLRAADALLGPSLARPPSPRGQGVAGTGSPPHHPPRGGAALSRGRREPHGGASPPLGPDRPPGFGEH